MDDLKDKLQESVKLIKNSSSTVAFTGAGISVESGIPPFRGKDGLWSKFNPVFLDIDYFHQHPEESWELIKKIFYDFFGRAKPNKAHYALAEMEKAELIQTVITQNIDNLHQIAGSREVYELHGNSRHLICTNCTKIVSSADTDISAIPPRCSCCGDVLKPDFVFFGEPLPEPAVSNSFEEAKDAGVFIIIGSTGEIMPASIIPYEAKKNGAAIIEINIEPSHYTHAITDVFLQGKATEITAELQSMF